MVSAPFLSTKVMKSISSQIAERVSYESDILPPGAPAGLGESLRVAMLTEDQIRSGTGPLASRVTETGQWHHQVYVGGVAAVFARSVEEPGAPGEPYKVVEVADAEVAGELHKTIAWVDANVSVEAEAEVLVAPSHLLTGLWLKGKGVDAVVISSGPALSGGIKPNQLISGEQFLDALARTPAIVGLGLPVEISEPHRAPSSDSRGASGAAESES